MKKANYQILDEQEEKYITYDIEKRKKLAVIEECIREGKPIPEKYLSKLDKKKQKMD